MQGNNQYFQQQFNNNKVNLLPGQAPINQQFINQQSPKNQKKIILN